MFDPSIRLALNLVIQSAGSHLYTVGLSHFSFGNQKRHIFYNPLIVFTITLLLSVRFLSLLVINDLSLFLYLGDFSHLFNIRYQYNIAVFLFCIMTIISQILHYLNYKHNITPVYLKPFKMISGLSTPMSIGLTDEHDIMSLVRLTKKLFIISNINTKFIVPPIIRWSAKL